ncbi:MAG: hypothetical protein LBU18_04035 [Treponema sp.]|nr:hypothetical protein [Treponema sp.]
MIRIEGFIPRCSAAGLVDTSKPTKKFILKSSCEPGRWELNKSVNIKSVLIIYSLFPEVKVSENKKLNSIEPFLLNRSEAARFLGIGLNTLGDLNIQKTRIRRRVLYRRDILEKWVKENTDKRAGV